MPLRGGRGSGLAGARVEAEVGGQLAPIGKAADVADRGTSLLLTEVTGREETKRFPYRPSRIAAPVAEFVDDM